jgi:hypothetical protein
LIGVVGANRMLLGTAFFGHELHELALIILLKIKYLLRMSLPLIRERKLVEFRIKWFEKSIEIIKNSVLLNFHFQNAS